MKTKTRVLSLLLTLAMVLSSLVIMPLTASAAVPTTWADVDLGDTTLTVDPEDATGNTYLISSAMQLAYFAKQVANGNTYEGKTVKLTQTIDVSAYDWSPIGGTVANKPFAGTFDGQGNTIKGLTFSMEYDGTDATKYTMMALFNRLNGATVKNLSVENNITASHIFVNGGGAGGHIGFFATDGYANGSKDKLTVVENCHVTINTPAEGTYFQNANNKAIGGFFSYMTQGTTLKGCTVNGTIFHHGPLGSDTLKFGGFVARAGANNYGNTKFIDCTSNVTVKVKLDTVTSQVNRVGGFVHIAQADDHTIEFQNCVNNAKLINAGNSANWRSGGFIAVMGEDTSKTANLIFNNCFDFGYYSVIKSGIGSLVGYYSNGVNTNHTITINNVFCAQPTSLNILGAKGSNVDGKVTINGEAFALNPPAAARLTLSAMNTAYYLPATNKIAVAVNVSACDLITESGLMLAPVVKYADQTKTTPDATDGTYNFFYFDPYQGTEYDATKATVEFKDADSDWALVREMGVGLSDGNAWTSYAASGFESGTGTSADPYLIANAAQLAYLAKTTNDASDSTFTANKYFKLIADIDLTGHEWVAIGGTKGTGNRFQGTFDGNGHVIANMTYTKGSVAGGNNFIGLFGYTAQGSTSIKNFTLTGTIKATVSYNNAEGGIGMIAAKLGGGKTIDNVNVFGHMEITSTVGEPMIGGLVGLMHTATIQNCSMNGSITVIAGGDGTVICQAGGILGSNTKGATIKKCTNNADITALTNGNANTYLGGIMASTRPISATDWNEQSNYANKSAVLIEGCVSNGVITYGLKEGVSMAASGYNQRIGGIIGGTSRKGGFSSFSNKTAGTDFFFTAVTIKDCIFAGNLVLAANTKEGSGSGIRPFIGYVETCHAESETDTATLQNGEKTNLKMDGLFIPVWYDANPSNFVEPYTYATKTFSYGANTSSDYRLAADVTVNGENAIIRVSKDAVETYLACGFTMNVDYGDADFSWTSVPTGAVVGNDCYEITVAAQAGADLTVTMTKTLAGKIYEHVAEAATWADFYTEKIENIDKINEKYAADDEEVINGTYKEGDYKYGTEANPFVIDSAAKLGYLADYIARTGSSYQRFFKIVGTIDLAGHEWLPIGLTNPSDTNVANTKLNYNNGFNGCGTLYGENAVIKNLTLTADRYNHSQAFIGYSAWIIKDLAFDGVKIEEAEIVGGTPVNAVATLVGAYYGGSITNVDVTNLDFDATYGTDGRYYGGLVGYVNNGGDITDCSVAGTMDVTSVDGRVEKIGGLAARVKIGDLINCTTDVDITATIDQLAGNLGIGGIVGLAQADNPEETTTLDGCSAAGEIVVNYTNSKTTEGETPNAVIKNTKIGVGELVGMQINGNGTLIIKNVISERAPFAISGDGTSNEYAGGLIGYAGGYALTLENCISANAAFVGGRSDAILFTETDSIGVNSEILTKNLTVLQNLVPRLDVEGMNLYASINKELYDSFLEKYNVQIGFVVAHADELDDKHLLAYNPADYADPETDFNGFVVTNDTDYIFGMAIASIIDTARDFTVDAYITITLEGGKTYTFTTDMKNEMSYLDAAYAAINDTSAEKTDEYVNFIDDGKWSKWSNNQYLALEFAIDSSYEAPEVPFIPEAPKAPVPETPEEDPEGGEGTTAPEGGEAPAPEGGAVTSAPALETTPEGGAVTSAPALETTPEGGAVTSAPALETTPEGGIEAGTIAPALQQ